MKLRQIFIFLLAVCFASCENDIDVVDQYRETLVVYSLLNANDSTHYIRVQKAYLGEGNAYLMAQHGDSIYPDTSAINLRIQKEKDGVALDSFIIFKPNTSISKEEGLFTNYPHVIYQSVDDPATARKEDYIDQNASYLLRLDNLNTGSSITAKTSIVKDVGLELTSPLLYPSSLINLANTNPFKIEVTMPKYGKILNLSVRFNYTEYTIGSNFFENKSVVYKLDDIIFPNANGGGEHTYEISGDKFYSFLKSHIKANPNVLRPAGLVSLDFIFTVGAEEFFNYYSVSNSSAFLSDVIPSYTNLSEGLGLFSSRTSKVYPDKKLTSASQDSLANGRFTYDIFD